MNSAFAAGVLIGVSAFGSGMLYLPAGFNAMGYVGACLVMVLLATLTWLSLWALNLVDDKARKIRNRKYDYSYFAESIGTKFSCLVSIIFIIANFLTCYCFFARMSELSLTVLNVFWKYESSTSQISLYLRLLFITLYPILSYTFLIQKDLSVLQPIAYMSLGTTLFYSFLMIGCGIVSRNSLSDLKPFNNKGVLSAIVRMIFAAHCQFAFFDSKNTLRSKTFSNSLLMITIGVAVIYGCYLTIGFFGYKYLGSAIKDSFILTILKEEGFDNNLLSKNNYLLPSELFKYATILMTACFIIIFFTGATITIYTFIPEIEKILSICGIYSSKNILCFLIIFLLWLCNLKKDVNIDLVLTLSAAIGTNSLSFAIPGIYIISSTKNNKSKVIGYSLVIASIVIVGLMAAESFYK